MKLVVQRVLEASVTVNEEQVAHIGSGLLVLIGVARSDEEQHARAMAEKLVRLRIFGDSAGKMNLSLKDTGGEALVVSQFTLLADCRKGNRPSFDPAAPPEQAQRLYAYFCDELRRHEIPVQTGIFRANMKVALINDGPVTILLETDCISGQSVTL
ncbi:MAG TPA: D-aminoacyl-tRNA deacylase [Bryobacteraceae bacterium]|nr:D-aminoacyl-tRNA deacylase [Bryobacteraceae bacterium]